MTIYNQNRAPILSVNRNLFPFPPIYDFHTPDGHLVMTAKQDSIWQFWSKDYTLYDANGAPFSTIHLDGISAFGWLGDRSAGQRLWQAYDSNLRLVAQAGISGWVWISYMLTRGDGGMLGEFTRQLSLTDNHTLNLAVDINRSLDRRIALALAVLIEESNRARRESI